MRFSSIPGVLMATLLVGNSHAAEHPGAMPVADSLATVSSPLGVPVADGRLAAARGGTSTRNGAHANGSVVGNSASHVATGMNVLEGGAFAHASGLTTIVQNSGANVLIQNAMVVNVQFGAAGQ